MIIENSQTWQDGVVLVYSTAVLVVLRLAATVRHSPLSPVRRGSRYTRLTFYSLLMLLVGLASTLTIFLLAVFSATRETATDLLPCASPLLAIIGSLALFPQRSPPQWESQALASLMGLPQWLVLLLAILCNAPLVAASVLTDAWATTSITVATSLIAVFGPRTAIVTRTLGNGVMESGRNILARVVQKKDETVVALAFHPGGKVVRELRGASWRELQSDAAFSHDGQIRTGVGSRIAEVEVSPGDADKLPLLAASGGGIPAGMRYVTLTSGETSDCDGYVALSEFLSSPVGDSVLRIECDFDSATLQVLGSVVYSATMAQVEWEFPGAADTYLSLCRRLIEMPPVPSNEDLGIPGSQMEIGSEVANQLQTYGRHLGIAFASTGDLPHPFRNALAILFSVRASLYLSVHSSRVLDLISDAVAGGLLTFCAQENGPTVDELCVFFSGLQDELTAESNDALSVLLTDRNSRSVRWYTRSEHGEVEKLLQNGQYAVIKAAQTPISDEAIAAGTAVAVDLVCESGEAGTRLRKVGGIINEETTFKRQGVDVEVSDDDWNVGRVRYPGRVWPVNWEPEEPLSAVGTLKGVAEVASLQAIASSIAVGTVLFGRLLGG